MCFALYIMENTISCNICENTFNKSELTSVCSTINCENNVCESCVLNLLRSHTNNSIVSIRSLQCPFCVQLMDFNKLEKYAITHSSLRESVANFKQLCNALIPTTGQVGRCVNCNKIEMIYANTTCNANNDSTQNQHRCDKCRTLEAPTNVSQCLQCKKYVVINGGCNHMTCVCGHQFCYVCKNKWGTMNCTFYVCNPTSIVRPAPAPAPAPAPTPRPTTTTASFLRKLYSDSDSESESESDFESDLGYLYMEFYEDVGNPCGDYHEIARMKRQEEARIVILTLLKKLYINRFFTIRSSNTTLSEYSNDVDRLIYYLGIGVKYNLGFMNKYFRQNVRPTRLRKFVEKISRFVNHCHGNLNPQKAFELITKEIKRIDSEKRFIGDSHVTNNNNNNNNNNKDYYYYITNNNDDNNDNDDNDDFFYA